MLFKILSRDGKTFSTFSVDQYQTWEKCVWNFFSLYWSVSNRHFLNTKEAIFLLNLYKVFSCYVNHFLYCAQSKITEQKIVLFFDEECTTAKNCLYLQGVRFWKSLKEIAVALKQVYIFYHKLVKSKCVWKVEVFEKF